MENEKIDNIKNVRKLTRLKCAKCRSYNVFCDDYIFDEMNNELILSMHCADCQKKFEAGFKISWVERLAKEKKKMETEIIFNKIKKQYLKI